MYQLWEALKTAKNYRWVELSHSMNNDSPYWAGIPEGTVELAKMCFDWGNPMLECLIQTFKFPGQFGTHIDFPGHFIKGRELSEKYDVHDLSRPGISGRRCYHRCLSADRRGHRTSGQGMGNYRIIKHFIEIHT